MRCPCCGEVVGQLLPLTGRSSDYSRLVCEDCYSNALAGDRQVWAFYWHDTPAVEDEVTWRDAGASEPEWGEHPEAFDDPWDAYMEAHEDSWPKYGKNLEDEGPWLGAEPPEARAWRETSWTGPTERPGSSAESLAELQARKEQILAASRGGAERLGDAGGRPQLLSGVMRRGGSWVRVLIMKRPRR